MAEPTYRLNRAEWARIQRLIRQTPGPLETPCWVWLGPQMPNGYGKHRVGPGKPLRAVHRIMWEHEHNAPIPDEMELDHLCRVRLCLRPDHFEVVTGSENTLRQDHAERRVTHCPKGHEYTEENTATRSGRRFCRACDRERKRPGPTR